MRYKIRTLLVITACFAVLALWARNHFTSPYGDKAPASLLSPIRTKITVHPNGIVQTRRITYSLFDYGISEFGNIRLAVANKPFSGKSSGTLLLSSNPALANSITSDSYSATGVGNRRFEHEITADGSSCRFGGLSFEIVDCELRLLNDTFPVDESPTLIVVNAKGEIEAVVEIPVQAATGVGSEMVGSEPFADPSSNRKEKSSDADDPFAASPFD
ncbi:hypothetical protein TBK1r_24910 [Stieleria magnilauensis]|uniref:Uncharacterized protein n=1 Tax=Stieleria magnilauensis TaxID=2527963 RepID=A0ABX5XNJ5_9BACT|nr:hypothetical protein TBK1r_24910 [Planctomycetes bacterium TBK1r]